MKFNRVSRALVNEAFGLGHQLGLTSGKPRSGDPMLMKVKAMWGEGKGLPDPIGKPGYTLPGLDGARVARMTGADDGNMVVLAAGAKKRLPIRIKVDAGRTGNVLVIGSGSELPRSVWFQGNNGLVIIGSSIKWPADLDIRLSSDHQVFFWGKGSTSNGTSVMLEGPETSAIVGDDCMFATSTAIRTSDMHAISSIDTGEWLNPPASVVLEPHVWVGEGSIVGKGVRIASGSVIGATSLVTRSIPGNCIAAGTPAKVIKKGIMWERSRSPQNPHRDQGNAAAATSDLFSNH